MHWGVACIAARAEVYAMDSLTDDQKKHSPDYIDDANVQPALKSLASIRYVQSPGTDARASNAHIVFSVRTICNPNPHHHY